MDAGSQVLIRAFRPSDRDILKKICADTAFLGEPVEAFLADRELFSRGLIDYYVDYEPESIFLAQDDKNVIGYIIGSKDEKKYSAITTGKIFPKLILKALGVLVREPSARILLLNLSRSFFRGELHRPDFSARYPAHLHINIASGYRGMGVGEMLMGKFIGYLKASKVSAVRLATLSKKATRFFEKMGFKLLYRRQMTYFKYLTDEELYLSIYGKIL